MGIEIVIAALVTVVVQVVKKLIVKIGSNATFLLVFVLCFVAALLANIGKQYLSADFIKTFWVIVGSQFAIWGIFIKYMYPKLKGDDNKKTE